MGNTQAKLKFVTVTGKTRVRRIVEERCNGPGTGRGKIFIGQYFY